MNKVAIRNKIGIRILLILFLSLMFIIVVYMHGTLTINSQNKGEQEGCLNCHKGIESIGESHKELSCDDCHQGDPKSSIEKEAHSGLFKNPGDLKIVEMTCGVCHEEIVTKVKKSMHATSAGIISGARYLWAAQKEKNSIFGVRTISDDDGEMPEKLGAVKSLDQLPHYRESNQSVDDYLRNQCLRCHLWTEGARRYGDYRSSGCSACHVLYSDDGLSHSEDKSIPKDEPGHPVRHEITSKIPSEQCVHCHNRGGRTGVSYLGMMESDGYGTPFNPDGSKQPKLHGKNYNYLQKDIHLEKGLHCIDCHTVNDIHGDDNIYSKKEQAVEIECVDCHGNLQMYSQLKSSRGSPLTNLERQNDRIVLKSKIDERLHNIPQIRGFLERKTLPIAMQIKAHMDKLECYACHAKWAPQCYGCHAKMDMRKKGFDWVDETKEATYQWEESRSYLRWETPALGINSEGKVSPFVPGCQAIFTQIDEEGKTKEWNKVFVTSDGHSGIAHNAIQPHTISRIPRSCENCHSESKALGLGSGHYISKLNGLDITFELERFVDEDGNQIQGTSHVGARPFNKNEIQKIKRVNVCLACHQEDSSIFWQKVQENWGKAIDSKKHDDILREILRNAIKK